MSITLPRAGFPSCSPREWRGGVLPRRLACHFSIHRDANPCKNPSANVSKPLHGCPSCPQTGARHEEHRPPGFPAFHAYGVQ